jgi:hypothetical protein
MTYIHTYIDRNLQTTYIDRYPLVETVDEMCERDSRFLVIIAPSPRAKLADLQA